MNHPREHDLALLAGGEAGPLRRLLLDRHVRNCAPCQEKIAAYCDLREDLGEIELPGSNWNEVNWNFLAADMRANIRLGLEAGACVRTARTPWRWKAPRLWKNPRPAIAFACVLIVTAAGELLRENKLRSPAVADSTPVLVTTDSGVEFRTGANSLTLLKHHGDVANQTVSARGDISERYIDDTGAVTINDVSLQ
jgi:hypothetical protein